MALIKWSNRGEELQVIVRDTTGLKVNKFLHANLQTCILA